MTKQHIQIKNICI